MSGYSDFLRDRSEEILARTEMSPEELASEKLTTQPASVSPAALEKRLRSMGSTLAKAFGKGLAEYVGKRIAPLSAAVEQAQRSLEAHGRVIDRLSNELAVLRRDFDLQQKLEEARNKRRVENLEVALLAAGRNPAEREDAEDAAELPDFREWRHAQ